jgi:hypothetical protein
LTWTRYLAVIVAGMLMDSSAIYALEYNPWVRQLPAGVGIQRAALVFSM